MTGDLTAAFDFASPDFSIPALPDTVPLITQSDAEKSFPAVTAPAEGAQAQPAQEPGHPARTGRASSCRTPTSPSTAPRSR